MPPVSKMMARFRLFSDLIHSGLFVTFNFIFKFQYSALLLLLSGLSYFIFYKEEVDDFEYNIKRGLIGVALVFIAFGFVQLFCCVLVFKISIKASPRPVMVPFIGRIRSFGDLFLHVASCTILF